MATEIVIFEFGQIEAFWVRHKCDVNHFNQILVISAKFFATLEYQEMHFVSETIEIMLLQIDATLCWQSWTNWSGFHKSNIGYMLQNLDKNQWYDVNLYGFPVHFETTYVTLTQAVSRLKFIPSKLSGFANITISAAK